MSRSPGAPRAQGPYTGCFFVPQGPQRPRGTLLVLHLLITSCICGPSSSPRCLIHRSPGGPKGPPRTVGVPQKTGAPGPPYGESLLHHLLCFPFISSCHHLAPLVIIEFLLSRLTSLITSCICGPSRSWGGPINTDGVPQKTGAPGPPYGESLLHHLLCFPFISSCHHLAPLVIVEFLLSRLTSLITSCICGPSRSWGDPSTQMGCPRKRGPQGPPTVNHCCTTCCAFLSFPLVIILHLLSSLNFSCHV
jgi:hypothetical protein